MKGRFNPSQPFIHPSLLPFPRLFIALPKCLHSYCHKDVSRLSSLWQSLCLYLTEQSHIASVCLWRVVKGYEGLEKPFFCLNRWYTTYYNQSMKSEGLTLGEFTLCSQYCESPKRALSAKEMPHQTKPNFIKTIKNGWVIGYNLSRFPYFSLILAENAAISC